MKTYVKGLLEQKEMDVLAKKFRLTTGISQNKQGSFTSAELLEEEKCKSFLDWLTNIIGSPSRMITASQFSKRYAFLVVASSLYAMSKYNKGLDFSIQNSNIEAEANKEKWISSIRLTNLEASSSTGQNREAWRDQVLKNIFDGHLTKVWHSISNVSQVPMAILWENTAVRVFSLYEKKIGEGETKEENSRIQKDFKYLIYDASATLFGEKENPLTKFYTPMTTSTSTNEPVRIRKTCCYYYEVSCGEFCAACPKVDH